MDEEKEEEIEEDEEDPKEDALRYFNQKSYGEYLNFGNKN